MCEEMVRSRPRRGVNEIAVCCAPLNVITIAREERYIGSQFYLAARGRFTAASTTSRSTLWIVYFVFRPNCKYLFCVFVSILTFVARVGFAQVLRHL